MKFTKRLTRTSAAVQNSLTLPPLLQTRSNFRVCELRDYPVPSTPGPTTTFAIGAAWCRSAEPGRGPS